MNRRIVLGLLCCVAIVGVVSAMWWLSRSREPVYQGRPLSVWLQNYGPNQGLATDQTAAKESDDAIRHMGTNAIPFLLAMLDETDPKIKVALNQLAATRSPVHLNLGDANTSHLKAMQAFAALGPIAKPAIPALADRLARGNWMVATILASIGLEAIPVLTNALAVTNPPIQTSIVQALGQFGTKVYMSGGTNLEPKETSDFRAAASLIIPVLVRCAHDPDETVRQTAYYNLTYFNQAPDISTPLLVELLSDKDPAVRSFATGVLCSSAAHAKAAASALLKVLHDPGKDVKRNALLALAYIGAEDTNVRPAVLEFLRDPDAELRCATLMYLAIPQSFGRFVIVEIAQALKDPDRNVRTQAARSLAQLGAVDPSAVLPALMNNLSDQFSEPREAAAKALGAQGAAASNATPALEKLLHDDVPIVRVAAAAALVKIAPENPVGLETLVKALSEPDINDSVMKACGALIELGPLAKPAIPELAKIVQDSDSPQVRYMATMVLLKLDPDNPAGLPALLRKLQDKDPAIRAETIRFVGFLGDAVGEDGRKALENALKDPDKEVRDTAAAALNRRPRGPL